MKGRARVSDARTICHAPPGFLSGLSNTAEPASTARDWRIWTSRHERFWGTTVPAGDFAKLPIGTGHRPYGRDGGELACGTGR